MVSVLGISVAVYAALFAFGLFGSDRLIFPRGPSSYKDTSEFIKLGTANGNKITALYLRNPSATFTLLVSHGNAEDLGDTSDWLEELSNVGFNVFCYDYEGYGTSEGTPSERRVYQDERAAYNYLLTRLKTPPNRVIAFGKSLGSGPAVHLAAREPIAGLILQSAFTSTFRVLTRIAILPFDKFPNYKDIQRVHCPVLVVHGTADRVVAFWHGQELYALAHGPKSCLWVDGADHNDLEEVAGQRYTNALRAFAMSLENRAIGSKLP